MPASARPARRPASVTGQVLRGRVPPDSYRGRRAGAGPLGGAPAESRFALSTQPYKSCALTRANGATPSATPSSMATCPPTRSTASSGPPRPRGERRPAGGGQPRPGPQPPGRRPGLSERGQHLEAFFGCLYYAYYAALRQAPARPHQEVRHHPRRADLPDHPGGILQDSRYNEVWTEARKKALTPAQYRSSLGRRPYDLRHAAVSLWLNSGVPATEVARCAGHGVAVLLKIYAHCIDGQATAANQRIAEALGIQDVEQDLGDEGDDDTGQAPEMAGQGGNSGLSGQRNRTTGPSVDFPPSSVGRPASVRGPLGPGIRRPRTRSGRASVLLERSVRTLRTVGAHRRLSTDGHGRAAPTGHRSPIPARLGKLVTKHLGRYVTGPKYLGPILPADKHLLPVRDDLCLFRLRNFSIKT
jgi:hypothetical protein